MIFPKKSLILPIGISGSGKSTWINSLPKNQFKIVSPDEIRKHVLGDISDQSNIENIFDMAYKQAAKEIKNGNTVIFDATNVDTEYRNILINKIKELSGVDFKTYYKLFPANPELSKKRIKKDLKNNIKRSDVPEDIIDSQYDLYKKTINNLDNMINIDSLNESLLSIRKIIREIIKEDYRFEYKKTYTPSDNIVNKVKKAQDFIQKNNLIQKLKTSLKGKKIVTGERRAKKIIERKPLSYNEIRALRDLFVSIENDYKSEKNAGKSIKDSSIIQIWELNGGKPAKDWVESILGQVHDKNMNSKSLRRGVGDRNNIGNSKNLMKARMPRRVVVKEEYNFEEDELKEILKGYLDAALWTEEERLKEEQEEYYYIEDDDEDNEEMTDLDKLIKITNNFQNKSIENFTKEDIEPNSLIQAYLDIKEFIKNTAHFADETVKENGYEQLGHDIWLTRNRHGAGFFDRGYDDETEKALIDAAQKLKEVDLYINDELKLSFSNV